MNKINFYQKGRNLLKLNPLQPVIPTESIASPNWVTTQMGKAQQVYKKQMSKPTQQLTFEDVRKMSLPIQATYSITKQPEEEHNAAIKRTPQARFLRHTVQTYANQVPKVATQISKGNYGKVLASTFGIPVDLISSIPINVLGYNMYTLPFKDIINSQYNRLSRNLTGDPSYTAIKGQSYNQYDMSKGMWDTAIEMQQRVNNGENSRKVATEMAKERIDPSYSYGSSRILFHPFNDTANYLWSIGAQVPASGDYYVDYYDNNKQKTDMYLRNLELGWKNNFSDWFSTALRGYGGLVTSQEEDPNDQKQAVKIPEQR